MRGHLIRSPERGNLPKNIKWDKDNVNFLKLFPLQANEIVTQRLIADRPNTYWELLNVGTNVLSHHMNRTAESTHNLESMLYNKVKTWANA